MDSPIFLASVVVGLLFLFSLIYLIFTSVGKMELKQIEAGYCKVCKKDMKRRGKIQDKLEEDMKVAAGIVDKPKKAAKKKSKSTGTLIVPPNTENLKVFVYGGAGSGSSILKIKEKNSKSTKKKKSK